MKSILITTKKKKSLLELLFETMHLRHTKRMFFDRPNQQHKQPQVLLRMLPLHDLVRENSLQIQGE